MWTIYAVGVLGFVLIALGWAGVQGAWGRVFPANGADPDVLARRKGCHDCAETERCDRRGAIEEGVRWAKR